MRVRKNLKFLIYFFKSGMKRTGEQWNGWGRDVMEGDAMG